MRVKGRGLAKGLLHGAIVVEAVYIEVLLPGVVDVVSGFLALVGEEDGVFPLRCEAESFLLADGPNHEVVEKMPLALRLRVSL